MALTAGPILITAAGSRFIQTNNMDHKRLGKKKGSGGLDTMLAGIGGIALFLLMGIVFYNSLTEDWRSYQQEFRQLIEERFGPGKAEMVPSGIRQIHVPELGKADRCITCHQGVEWKGLSDAAEPFRTHPTEILNQHPLAKFACTSCHDGQGFATETVTAHGLVAHWEEPLLGKELSDFYVLNDRRALMQLKCNLCHRYERETEGAPVINRAKKIVQDRGCRACHVINGRGGNLGPDLTWEGDKSPEQFNYERISGFHSQFTWQVAHLKNPKELVPETVMPNFNFSSQDAQALTLLMMSWRKTDLPIEYVPSHNFRDLPTPEELERERRMREGPGSFFVKKNCFVCHSVSTLGIDAAAQIGPDLALAVSDVQSRFGRTLDDFLARPSGTMEVVLSTMISLTPEERVECVEKLRYAYSLRGEIQAGRRQKQ